MTISKKNNFKNSLSILTAFVFVYVVLFEFILPVNRVLPKPSLLFESFIDVWIHYELLNNLIVSLSVIYFAITVGYLIISVLAGYLIKINFEFPGIFNGFRMFRYFPAFFYALVFAFWFEGSIIGEFIFALIGAVVFTGIALNNSLKEIKPEYLLAAQSLGIKKRKIYGDVAWKLNQPAVVKSLPRLHIYLWVLVLIFEFVGAHSGLGNIYRLILYYNDFAALFASALFISFIILLGSLLIGWIEKKLITWEP